MKQTWNHSLLVVGMLAASSFTLASSVPEASTPTPSFLMGKQVKSTIVLKKSPGSTPSGSQGNRSVSMAGPSDQTISRVLSVTKDKGDDLLLERSVKRVQMTIVSVLGQSIYDSDNTFERDPVTSALGQRYDPYINKPFKVVYRPKSNSTDQTARDSKFEVLWSTNMPALLKETALQGILLPELPKNLAPGSTWVDSVTNQGNTTVNRYTVVKKEGDLWHLKLDSQQAPTALQSPGTSSATGAGSGTTASIVGTIIYKGDLRVRQSSGFIEELRLTKESASTVIAAGQTMQNNSSATVLIQNTLN